MRENEDSPEFRPILHPVCSCTDVHLQLLQFQHVCHLSVNTILTMLIAFCTGLATDALSDAVLGLNALALTPVALLRKPIIRMVMGEETIERQETFTVRKNGFLRISLAIVLSCCIFMAIYIIADGAGTRPLWFNAARFFASVASSYLLSLIIVKALTPEK